MNPFVCRMERKNGNECLIAGDGSAVTRLPIPRWELLQYETDVSPQPSEPLEETVLRYFAPRWNFLTPLEDTHGSERRRITEIGNESHRETFSESERFPPPKETANPLEALAVQVTSPPYHRGTPKSTLLRQLQALFIPMKARTDRLNDVSEDTGQDGAIISHVSTVPLVPLMPIIGCSASDGSFAPCNAVPHSDIHSDVHNIPEPSFSWDDDYFDGDFPLVGDPESYSGAYADEPNDLSLFPVSNSVVITDASTAISTLSGSRANETCDDWPSPQFSAVVPHLSNSVTDAGPSEWTATASYIPSTFCGSNFEENYRDTEIARSDVPDTAFEEEAAGGEENAQALWRWLDNNGAEPPVIMLRAKGQPSLSFVWALPPIVRLYRHRPLAYIKYMMASGSRRSLRRDLQRRGWATDLIFTSTDNSLITFAYINIGLTSVGRSHLDEIVDLVVATLNEVKKRGVDHNIMLSLVERSRLEFHLQEPTRDVDGFVGDIADALHYVSEPGEVLAEITGVIQRPDRELTEQFLSLMTPERMILLVADADFAFVADATADEIQAAKLNMLVQRGTHHLIQRWNPFYQFTFVLAALDRRRVRDLQSIDLTTVNDHRRHLLRKHFVALSLPGAIRRLPKAHELRPAEHLPVKDKTPRKYHLISSLPPESLASSPRPQLLTDLTGYEVWWRGRGLFGALKAHITFAFRYRKSAVSLDAGIANLMFFNLVSDLLEPSLQSFADAGYSVDISVRRQGFFIELSGYHDRAAFVELSFLVGTAMRKAFIKVSESRYQRLRREQIEDYLDVTATRPTSFSLELARAFLLNGPAARAGFLPRLANNTGPFKSYSAMAPLLQQLRSVHATVLSTGLNRAETAEIVRVLIVQSTLAPVSRRSVARTLDVNLTGLVQLAVENPIPSDSSHAALLMFKSEAGLYADDVVEFQVLANMFAHEMMEQLRTQRQLGYIAGARVDHLGSSYALTSYVEGPRENATTAMSAIEEVIASIGSKIVNMTADEIADWRASARAGLDPDPINSEEEHTRIWKEIDGAEYCFDRILLTRLYLENEAVWGDAKQAKALILSAFEKFVRQNRRQVRIFVAAGASDHISSDKSVTTVGTDEELTEQKHHDVAEQQINLMDYLVEGGDVLNFNAKEIGAFQKKLELNKLEPRCAYRNHSAPAV